MALSTWSGPPPGTARRSATPPPAIWFIGPNNKPSRSFIFKDETVKPAKKHLRIAVADNPEGPFGPPGPPFTRAWVEGPTALRVGEKYVVYFDCYRDKHYGAVQSGDLVHWEDVTDRLSLPAGVRHGTALAVPGSVLAPLYRTNLPPVSGPSPR